MNKVSVSNNRFDMNEDIILIDEDELNKMNVKYISLSYRNETTDEENPNLTLKEFYDANRKGQ